MSTEREILLPDIGDFDSVEVIDIAVKPGDKVDIEDTLITLESDKATMDIPSPAAGIVKEIMVSVGDQVNEKALILILTESGDVEKSGKVLPSSDETPTKKTAAVGEKRDYLKFVRQLSA